MPYLDHLPLEEVSLPETLGKAGYHTWQVGKWHLCDERPELMARLAGMLAAWRESVEAKIPQPKPDYVSWQ